MCCQSISKPDADPNQTIGMMSNSIESFETLCKTVDGLFDVSIDTASRPKGASVHAIDRCEKDNKWCFPDELRAFIELMNGEAEDADPSFFSGVKFCSLENMTKVNDAFLGIEPNLVNFEPGEFKSVERNPFIPQDRRWQRYWIPLAAEHSCETVLFLDPKPVKTNFENMIFWSYEDTNCGPPIATCLEGLFDSITKYVRENGQLPSITKLPAIELTSM